MRPHKEKTKQNHSVCNSTKILKPNAILKESIVNDATRKNHRRRTFTHYVQRK